jgi:copper/silver efflux system protein
VLSLAGRRLRPKCMLFGLLPIMWLVGAGGDVMKRIAAPMIGGILTSFLIELVIYTPMFAIWKWNFEVKPKLKKSKPPQFTPEPQQEMVNV